MNVSEQTQGKRAGLSVIAALSELAATVQRQRTVDAVLETAGRGVLRLGMRLGTFQLCGDELVLRYMATAPLRLAAIERQIGRPIVGLRARADEVVLSVVKGRRILFRHDLDVFAAFLREATGYDPSHLDGAPETAGVTNGVLAPIFVRDEPWGLIAVYSGALTRNDADAVALFATHVGSALEVAESLEALANARTELLEHERLAALGELAAVVAHEVRNPLGVLFNAIGSLRSIVDAGAPASRLGDARTLLSIAAEESDRLSRIVSDLLQFARRYEVELEACSLPELVGDVAADIAHDPRMRVELDDALPLVAMDRRFMRQALLNLVLNGLQAVPAPGGVTVRARLDEKEGRARARLEVSDTGPGIPANVRSSMFEPFVTTKASGTGLGLAIVKRIVDAHRGELAFESGPTGTTFSIALPLENARA